MPTIEAYPDPFRAYNRVEVNWADLPGVEYARVLRVDVETGVCTPLRPYICYLGDYLKLSCGHGIFWDTEVPLDRQVYYITEGLDAPCVPDPALAQIYLDNFNRVVADSWGTPTIGDPYTVYSGPLTQYDVTGTEGTITPDTLAINRYVLTDVGTPDYVAQGTLTTNTTPTGGNIGAYGVVTRWVDDTNYIRMGLSINTAGLVTVFITRVVAAVTSVTSVLSPFTLAASDLHVKVSVIGGNLKIRVWPVAGIEPAGWDVEVFDASLLTSTMFGAIARRDAGNVTPTVLAFENFFIDNTCQTCTPVTVDTSDAPMTMPSNGAFRLKDPVRPCNDLYVGLCFDQVPDPGCLPGSGIFFAAMDTETYDSNTLLLNPTNASRPIAVNRARRDRASTLVLVTRTFADRDNLLKINFPGSPLLFQGPPNYGIGDTYMSVGEIGVERGKSDHRFPIRINQLPFLTVDRPAGPSQGVCGSRVADLCDLYPTIADLEAAGLSWDDLIRGRASDSGGPGLADYRTWDDVLAEFADWDDVNDGTRTWTGVQVGD